MLGHIHSHPGLHEACGPWVGHACLHDQLRLPSRTPGRLSHPLGHLHPTGPTLSPMLFLLPHCSSSAGFQCCREWHPSLPGGQVRHLKTTLDSSFSLTPDSYQSHVLQLYLLSIFRICSHFSILTSLWGRSPSTLAQIIVTVSKWGSLLLVLSVPPTYLFTLLLG